MNNAPDHSGSSTEHLDEHTRARRPDTSSPQVRDFLSALWPPSHYFHQLGTLDRDTKRFQNISVVSIDDAIREAQLQAESGKEVYVACAAYSTADGRTEANAAGAFCFFLDIDVGPIKAVDGKGYAAIGQAYRSCPSAWCKSPARIG